MYQVANFITVKLSCQSSLIAELDCGLDRWTGLLDWIAGLDCSVVDPEGVPWVPWNPSLEGLPSCTCVNSINCIKNSMRA